MISDLPSPKPLFTAAETRTFSKKAPPGGGERTFVHFILEPLYKIYGQVRKGGSSLRQLTRGHRAPGLCAQTWTPTQMHKRSDWEAIGAPVMLPVSSQ